MNKLGFYVQTPTTSGLFDAMREVRPPVMLVHAVNRGWLEDVHRFSPDTFIVGRLFVDRPQQDDWLSVPDPARPGGKRWLERPAARAQGRAFAEQILALDPPLATATWPYGGNLDDPSTRLLVDAWMTLNEFVQGPASDDFKNDPVDIQAKAAAFDAFQNGFIKRLKEAHPRLEGVAFNFGAGNFPDAKGYLNWFPRTLENYTYLGFHEYGWPTLRPQAGSATSGGDHRRIMAGIQKKYPGKHKVIITEAGLARMHKVKDGGDVGWLFERDTIAEEDYWQSLAWYNEQLSEQDYVIGACLYNVGYEGDWRTFRHTGADNEGRTITLMDRIRALREETTERAPAAAGEAPAEGEATAQDMVGRAAVHGRVSSGGRPVPDAQVRLFAGDDKLGGDPRAAVDDPGAVSWTRTIADFEGSAWNCWQRFVANEVAGLTWEEFEFKLGKYNPSLRDGGRLVAGQTYLIPEQRRYGPGMEPEIAWDRPLMGFRGGRWSCWQRYVRGKVPGLTWEGFRAEVGTRNPQLAAGGRFFPDKSYVLPRDPEAERYVRFTHVPAGRPYRFGGLLPGRYQLEVTAEGYEPVTQVVVIEEDVTLDVEMAPVAYAPVEAARAEADVALEAAAVVVAGPFVTVRGTQFIVGGRPFQFTGVNLRGLVYYGKSDKYPGANQKDQLRAVRDMGARVVRLFLPYKKMSTAEVSARLSELLALMQSEFSDMYLILALTDVYINSEHYVRGDDGFYRTRPDGWTLLCHDWFEAGYKQNYVPFVEAIVRAFKAAPRIMAWEIGNELKNELDVPGCRVSYINFNLDMAARIRKLDPNHLIGTGMMSTRHAGLFAPGQRKLYGSPNIQFVTSHIYNADYADDDHALAAELKKPYLVEEAGFDGGGGDDRSGRVRSDMDVLYGVGARGYMQWGFMAGGDNGDGDASRGMDQLFHSDWNPLFQTYKDRANSLG